MTAQNERAEELLDFFHNIKKDDWNVEKYNLNNTGTVLWFPHYYPDPVVIGFLKTSQWELLHKWQQAHEKAEKLREPNLITRIIRAAIPVSMLAMVVSAIAQQTTLLALFAASTVIAIITYMVMDSIREGAGEKYYCETVKQLKSTHLCQVPIYVDLDDRHDCDEIFTGALDRITPAIRDKFIASCDAGKTEVVLEAIETLLAEERKEKACRTTKAAAQILRGRPRSTS